VWGRKASVVCRDVGAIDLVSYKPDRMTGRLQPIYICLALHLHPLSQVDVGDYAVIVSQGTSSHPASRCHQRPVRSMFAQATARRSDHNAHPTFITAKVQAQYGNRGGLLHRACGARQVLCSMAPLLTSWHVARVFRPICTRRVELVLSTRCHAWAFVTRD
jgi:hypothetical protein